MAENEMQDSVKEVNDVNIDEGEPRTETVIEVNDVESRKPVQEVVIEDKIDTGRYERSLTTQLKIQELQRNILVDFGDI